MNEGMEHRTAVRMERPSKAAATIYNLNGLSAKIRLEETWKMRDRNTMTLYMGDGLRLLLVALHQGALVKSHRAECPISVQILQGFVEFKTEEETFELKKGLMLSLQSGVTHEILAMEESVFLLAMGVGSTHPVDLYAEPSNGK